MTQKIALRSFELMTNDFELWDYIEKLAVSEYRASLEKEIEKLETFGSGEWIPKKAIIELLRIKKEEKSE